MALRVHDRDIKAPTEHVHAWCSKPETAETALETAQQALASRASRSEALHLVWECEQGVAILGLTLLEDGSNDTLVPWFEKMLAKLRQLRETLDAK